MTLVSVLRCILAIDLVSKSWAFILLPAVNHIRSKRPLAGSHSVLVPRHFAPSIGSAHFSEVVMYGSPGDVATSNKTVASLINDASSWTSAELMKLKAPALKELCRSRKLLVSGTKAVLVDRLLVWASSASDSDPKKHLGTPADLNGSTERVQAKSAAAVTTTSHESLLEQPQEGDVVEVVGDDGLVYRAVWTTKQVYDKQSGELMPNPKLVLVLDLPDPPPPLPPRSQANADAISSLAQLVRKYEMPLRPIDNERSYDRQVFLCFLIATSGVGCQKFAGRHNTWSQYETSSLSDTAIQTPFGKATYSLRSMRICHLVL